MATDVMIFQFIGDTMTAALDSYVNTVAGAVISSIAATAVIAGGLYFAVMGTLMALGRIDGAFSQLIMACIKFMLVAAIALNVGTYSSFVVDSVHGMETGFQKAFSGDHGAAPASVYESLDKALQDGWDVSAVLYERASGRGVTKIGTALSEIMLGGAIALATMLIAVPAGAMVVAGHAMIALLLGIGPLFILAIGWGPTKQFFDRWFGQVLTAVLQVALVSAVLAIAVRMFTVAVTKIDVDDPSASTLFAILTVVVLTVVMLYLMYRAWEIAGSLGGGMASGAVTLGQMAARAAGVGSFAKNAINPVSTRRDMNTGMMVSGTRADHMASGNTMWNPRYRQAVSEQMFRHWGRSQGGSVKGN